MPVTSAREHAALVLRLLQPGDTVTHERCMGCLEEHIFLGLTSDGTALRGRPTRDTVRLEGSELEADDIAPACVTHINRVPVDVVELLSTEWRDRMRAVAARAVRPPRPVAVLPAPAGRRR